MRAGETENWKLILHRVSICILVWHLPAALDDDEKQESG